MKKQAAVKEVTVLFTYRFTKISRICFEVLSSNETDKYTTCFDGSVEKSSCTCRGGDFHNCYHVKQLAGRAAQYFDSRKAEPAAPVKADPVAEAQAFIAKVQAAKAVAPRRQVEAWTETEEAMYNAPLTSNKPFSLMR